jgi:hypothetical protein
MWGVWRQIQETGIGRLSRLKSNNTECAIPSY